MRRVKFRLVTLSLALIGWLTANLALASTATQACIWPAWEDFKQQLISPDGRVIDFSRPDQATTSEGQSYALFFALVAQDKTTFARLLQWTQHNLASAGLDKQLPAWLWGKASSGTWEVLDANNASDSDLWIAYSLLEAGRLWHLPEYTRLGQQVLDLVVAGSLRNLPGLGLMLLPADYGFESAAGWRLNPSYLPPQLLERFATTSQVWYQLATNSYQLLLNSAPLGYAPDWVLWTPEGQFDFGGTGTTASPVLGSYDAIRVYLWLGMLAKNAPHREALLQHFAPMAEHFLHTGTVPESVDIFSGEPSSTTVKNLRVAVLPYLINYSFAPANADLIQQRIQELRQQLTQPLATTAYYSRVLALFAEGWDKGKYSFSAQGQLQPAWEVAPCL